MKKKNRGINTIYETFNANLCLRWHEMFSETINCCINVIQKYYFLIKSSKSQFS